MRCVNFVSAVLIWACTGVQGENFVRAWGDNSKSQLNGSSVTNAVAVSAGAAHTAILLGNGRIVTWGSFWNGSNYVAATNPPLTDIVSITSGFFHCVALSADGHVSAWGYNEYGAASVPPGLMDVKQISAGGDHSLALTYSGNVYAWGRGTANSTTVPRFVRGAAAISAGQVHNLALMEDGTVYGWGANYSGQATGVATPSGTAEGWVLINGSLLQNVSAISAGGNHSLALRTNGTVVAWGQVWLNGTPTNAFAPAGLSNVVAISAGFDHDIALLSNGTVVVWGASDAGQSNPPPGLTNILAISAGYRHSAVVIGQASQPGLQHPNLYAGFIIRGPVGVTHTIESSDRLDSTNWTVITNLDLPTDPFLFIDTTTNARPRVRLYRVRIP